MSLIVYECQRADHGHEIRQFETACKSLYEYFDGRDETAVFIGNVNIGEANLDGLIIKNDAIIIVEFKDYEGDLVARQNGNWTCNGKPIKGGNGGKSVFEQLRNNRRILKTVIAENEFFSHAQRSDIKGLVVLSKLKGYSDDFDRTNKAWISVSDVENIGKSMHGIKSRPFANSPQEEVFISEEDLFNFLRKFNIDESTLITDYSDTNIMPSDLYSKEYPHNGKYMSTATQLAEKKEEVDSLKKQIDELMFKLDKIKEDQNIPQPSTETTKPIKKRFGMKERVLKEFNVDESSLDSEQIGLIERELDNSMIVSGCAGSGKSVIAMYKAQQIQENGGDVILIAFTKSLNKYMSQGNDNIIGGKFYYHWQWENAGKPQADYIIVDEIQDFSKSEIQDFVKASRKCFFFFGDSAQSIYSNKKSTMTIEELSKMLNVKVSKLNSNYRLSKPVAKITQPYVGVDANPYADGIYQSKETSLPHFASFSDDDSQIDAIISTIQKNNYKNVGILVPNNDLIITAMQKFVDRKFVFELKYNAGYNDPRNIDTLNFRTSVPKLMTYHSAKGLQFETVFLPFFEGTNNTDARKALYVAMTRTYRFLYVLYKGEEIAYPLSNVGKELYLNTL